MKLLLSATLSVMLSLMSFSSSAAFQHADWSVAGDKKATLDTDSGLTWLKLGNTVGKSVSAVESLLSTTYKGWRLPTSTEVEQMMNNFFTYSFNAGATTYSWASHNAQVNNFRLLMGSARYEYDNMYHSHRYWAYGMYRSNDCASGDSCVQMSGTFQRSTSNAGGQSYDFKIYEDYVAAVQTDTYADVYRGVWLVKADEPIPEQPSVVSSPLFGFGAFLLPLLLILRTRRM